MVMGISGSQGAGGVKAFTYKHRLERACEEFESIFISYILKSAGSASAENGLFGKRNEGKIIRSMFDENLAHGIARGGGIGLATMLFEQLIE